MYEVSQERKKYHLMQDRFITMIRKGCKIYDIGVSDNHNYRGKFYEFDYKTIDCDKDKAPDIILDIETIDDAHELPLADALLCNGVVECCNDPMKMIGACNNLLNPGGKALFGMILPGYPVYANRYFRFTTDEAKTALESNGFIIGDCVVVQREGIDSYIYIFCHKAVL